jgi:hypothetical protein
VYHHSQLVEIEFDYFLAQAGLELVVLLTSDSLEAAILDVSHHTLHILQLCFLFSRQILTIQLLGSDGLFGGPRVLLSQDPQDS